MTNSSYYLTHFESFSLHSCAEKNNWCYNARDVRKKGYGLFRLAMNKYETQCTSKFGQDRECNYITSKSLLLNETLNFSNQNYTAYIIVHMQNI